MGLLDEAIREHLDLKRSRGADPGEVAREETEALGPAVRAAPAEEEAAAAVLDAPPEAEAGPPPAEAEAAPAPPAEAFVEPHPAEEHAVPPPAERPRSDETAAFDAEELFADEDAAEVEEPGPQPGEGSAAEPAGEDVLEETPEFLQETPEHDRLWFEQKPPKDFDFDG